MDTEYRELSEDEIVEAIENVVNHYWHSERAHFLRHQAAGRCMERHIFTQLEIVRSWLLRRNGFVPTRPACVRTVEEAMV